MAGLVPAIAFGGNRQVFCSRLPGAEAPFLGDGAGNECGGSATIS